MTRVMTKEVVNDALNEAFNINDRTRHSIVVVLFSASRLI